VNHLTNFVDSASHQIEAHSLHYKHFYGISGNVTVLTQSFERQTAVIFAYAEYEFKEGNDAHFLLQILKFFHDNGESSNEFLVLFDCIVEGIDVASSKSLEQIIKPIKV
jgi:hypothetical protein